MLDKKPPIVRALGLCSGGLDSILSALVLRRQRIHVEWITFETPFFSADKARKAAEQTGIALHVREITDDYLVMLKNPPAGYGKNMNPCMDCHALMFNKAGRFMKANHFDFLFSGEVVGQRPMSQNAPALRYVARNSGFDGCILRPLSARRLAQTPMEQNGLVDRSQLLDLNGRSRKPQMAMADEWGIHDYPSPAGGCLLTDPGFSRRLRDLMDHGAPLTRGNLNLLQHGRHMRLDAAAKIIVGRTKQDNDHLIRLHDPQHDAVLKVADHPGPTVLLPGGGPDPAIHLAASICAGYSKAPRMSPATVRVAFAGRTHAVTVIPIAPREAKRFLIT
ncbi:MAG: tRNA 4-thiouridine(8) synthase ThiI [Desulfatitalea sp.]|nr:tRNA 4-thiouridine(8) synthase ThiI [Desulfatitalea sp.]